MNKEKKRGKQKNSVRERDGYGGADLRTENVKEYKFSKNSTLFSGGFNFIIW